MSINEIERMDTVIATVTKSTLGGGAYLKIDELDDAVPTVRLYDTAVCDGDKLLVSVRKISDDRCYIKTTLDSIISTNYAVA